MTDTLSIGSLVPAVRKTDMVRDRLRNTTFVGIDFGTSTTVASYATLGDSASPIKTEPIPIPQQLPRGRRYDHHLVPSVIAWHSEQLLIGMGAAKLKNSLKAGHDVWSSFKMDLGVDLGPQYYNTALPQGHPVATIETPRDAARVYFEYLKHHIEKFVKAEGLPGEIKYCVSTPASFEANQRRDLLHAIHAAGIELPEQAFIDEPNAAFLSYLSEANMNSLGSLNVPRDSPLHLLVFDFGAGTCDISILEIGQGAGAFYSKNLAISRFEALGGDDIDREVVREVLLPGLLEQNGMSRNDLSTVDFEKRILPGLGRTAEMLKITACKAVTSQMIGTALPATAASEEPLVLDECQELTLPRHKLTLEQPSMSPKAFADVMEPFLERDERKRRQRSGEAPISIFEPMESALLKAGLEANELDMILLIGGSSQNPYLQAALHEFSEAEVEIPRDLRAHVSTGAALNSLLLNGLQTNIIRPITSEPVLVVTKDQGLRTLIRAGTEIPSEPVTIQELMVGKEGQARVEVPICVSSENKILSVIEIESWSPAGFEKGTPVHLTCEITGDKLLKVTAAIDGKEAGADAVNPFSNRELTTQERAVLEAEKVANGIAARNNGRPTVAALKHLKEACIQANEYLRAAELTETLSLLDKSGAYEAHISLLYSKAGNDDLTSQWAEKAYKRNKTATHAFNLALSRRREGDQSEYERLMEEALQLDASHLPTLEDYGTHLMTHGDESRGKEMVERAFNAYDSRFKRQSLHENNYSRLIRAARTLGRRDVVAQIREEMSRLEKEHDAYDANNLLATHEEALVKTM